MDENSTSGVSYYQGTLPPSGIYADGKWLDKGKEPSCLFAATITIALTILVALLWH